MKSTVILSVGGSIVVPDEVDVDYIRNLKDTIDAHLEKDSTRRVIIVVGGGKLARRYQQAYRDIHVQPDNDEADWIGIAATHLNGRLLKSVFSSDCDDPVVTNPSVHNDFTGRVLIAAGWKPGFSTDFDAVLLAEQFDASLLVNLTNIEKIYTADPKIDPSATPIDSMTWGELRSMVGDEWTPGKNTPFDPSAVKKASEMHLKVVSAEGRDLRNVTAILEGDDFIGTTIGPN